MDRRAFLQSMAATTAGLMFGSGRFAAEPQAAASAPAATSDRLGELLPQRRLGRTGATVTMLGVGGWHIGRMEEKEAAKVIDTALEQGVRFFDSAEAYQGGESERRYGKYLTPKHREQVFLMTKTQARDADAARRHLDGSLQRLNTDYLDLWQMHSLGSAEDATGRLEAGVLEVLLEAKQRGKARHIGFTGHRTPEAHAAMLEKTEAHETLQMPINLIDPHYASFIDRVLPTANERQMGVLAMKTLSNGYFFRERWHRSINRKARIIPEYVTIEQALHFVWSLPVATLITGPDDAKQMAENAAIARRFTALDAAQRQALVEQVAEVSGKMVEYYKA
jgi:aryl-alcohol dehydrogenase-like predicted oxidoreductase